MEDLAITPCHTPPELHPERFLNDALEDSITALAANIAAATWQLLTLIAEFDRREVWGNHGLNSCAHWLNWQCGIALGAAREKVRVARALEHLPLISAAFAAGVVSYSKVRAMTRVATPENEDTLLMIARHGTAMHVEQTVRAYRQVQRIEETEKANGAHRARSLDWYYDDDGMLVIQARLPAETGAMLLKALAAAADDLAADDVPTGQIKETAVDADVPAGTSARAAHPAAVRRADALCLLGEQFLAHGAVTSRQTDRHQIVVHVDRDTLRAADRTARCEIEHGPALAAETARRLACDAGIVQIEEDADGQPLAIGRKTRAVPSAIRRALEARDRGCRFPGCTRHRTVDSHHIRHWADGGETSVQNLVLLCRHHHQLVHEGGFSLERRDDGKLLFLRPDGLPLPEVPAPTPATEDLAEWVRASGLHVSAETCVPNWRGERLDLDHAVLGLLQSDGRMNNTRMRLSSGS